MNNISKIALLDTNFGLHFLSFYLTETLHFWNLSLDYEYISNERFYKHSAGNYGRTLDIVRPKCCKCPNNIAICWDIMSKHLIDLALVLEAFLHP